MLRCGVCVRSRLPPSNRSLLISDKHALLSERGSPRPPLSTRTNLPAHTHALQSYRLRPRPLPVGQKPIDDTPPFKTAVQNHLLTGARPTRYGFAVAEELLPAITC